MIEEQENDDANKNKISSLDGAAPQQNGEQEAGDLQEALAARVEEHKALNDKYLRLAAEFENYKRLMQRDQRDQIKFGNEQLLKELLPVIDNMERAIKAARENDGNSALVEGVDLTLKQLAGVLTKFGVQPVETVGLAFDPSTHQAVAHIPSETVPSNHVVDEFQKGYRLHDRILRASMVSVSSGSTNTQSEDSLTN